METRASARRLAWSTAVFSLATGLSRILGLGREIVAANYFGARGPINAFTVAFQIPNLVRALVADAALSAAFVPVFSELLEKGERARAWRVASTVFWLLLLGLTGITAAFVLAAPLLVPPMTDAYDGLAVRLAQLLFPIVVLLGVSGVIVGILNSYEHFTIPALTPVFWNLAIIAGLVIGVPQAESESARLYVYAGSILAGTVLQVALPVPWLRGRDGSLRLALDLRDPAVKQVFRLMGPVTLSLGLINVNAVIGTIFAARLIDATIAPNAIDKAFRVYMLPQGMFSVAVATVLFPALSRLAARRDLDGFRATVSLGLRQINFLLVPAAAASAILAEPIVRLLYERGRFDPDQTTVVAGALAAFSLGLAFNGMMLMLNRGFFSLQQPWLPTWVALGNVVLNVALYAALYRVGVWGIPLAVSLANVAGAAMLLVLMRRRLGRIDFRSIVASLARVLVAAAALAGAAYGVWWALDDALGRSFGAQLASVSAALAAGSIVYLVMCRALGVREIQALLSLRARFRRA
ncbi:MAG: murein biosynthesis integral membrane protein MurJ [Thermoleophilia bacterium]|nr:murein biosynthesis integral membrane protein MurJ [Thermoleophilia bacterium]